MRRPYFSNPGYYVLTLTASDGTLAGAMSVIVKVLAPAGGGGTAPSIAVAGQPVNQTLNPGQPGSPDGDSERFEFEVSMEAQRHGDRRYSAGFRPSYVLQSQTLDYSGAATQQLTIAGGDARSMTGATYFLRCQQRIRARGQQLCNAGKCAEYRAGAGG